jgi:hypothetical protein
MFWWNLKVEAEISSEMLVTTNKTIWCYKPEDHNRNGFIWPRIGSSGGLYLSTVTNLWVSQMVVNVLASKETIRFSRILLHGVKYTKKHKYTGTQHFKYCIIIDQKQHVSGPQCDRGVLASLACSLPQYQMERWIQLDSMVTTSTTLKYIS